MESLLGFATNVADVLPLAHWDDGDGPHWWFVFWPLTWFLVIAALLYLFRFRAWRGGRSRFLRQHESGIEVLERRFAEGELDADQYHQRRSVLEADTERKR